LLNWALTVYHQREGGRGVLAAPLCFVDVATQDIYFVTQKLDWRGWLLLSRVAYCSRAKEVVTQAELQMLDSIADDGHDLDERHPAHTWHFSSAAVVRFFAS
jgi:hypothetical protein